MNVRAVILPLTLTAAVALCTTMPAGAQVARDGVVGTRNLARIEAQIACGAMVPSSMGDMKKLGFASVINLRQANEQNAFVDEETAAARTAGIGYVHLPFNAAMPDAMLVDKFLAAVTAPANHPALIHCASGGRAATMWMIKRALVDNWDVDRAAEEATGLGMTTPELKTYALEQIRARKK